MLISSTVSHFNAKIASLSESLTVRDVPCRLVPKILNKSGSTFFSSFLMNSFRSSTLASKYFFSYTALAERIDGLT